MKKLSAGKIALIILAVVIAVVLIIAGVFITNYNSLVTMKANVEALQSDIDVVLQKRVDLIPNLVNTVKGYAAHETEVIKSVSDARAKLAGAATMNEKNEANNELTSALSRLLVVKESYPELKANEQFAKLMDELAGLENRISVARKKYNDGAKEYNIAIKKFPKSIFAGIFGYETAEYFESSEGADTPPSVDFTK